MLWENYHSSSISNLRPPIKPSTKKYIGRSIRDSTPLTANTLAPSAAAGNIALSNEPKNRNISPIISPNKAPEIEEYKAKDKTFTPLTETFGIPNLKCFYIKVFL